MRRMIAAALAAALWLSGCNSIASSSSLQINDAVQDDNIMPTYKAVSEIMTGMPDYVEVDQNKKYDTPGQTAAFFIPETYSRQKADIQSFELLGVAGENTVLYSFATKVIAGSGAGQEVHSVAKYNYENNTYQEFHQTIGPPSTDLEPFHARKLKEATGLTGVAVYDRGNYYYYDMDGTIKIRASIGDFIQKQYIKNVSTQITSIVMAKPTRMYMHLTIQKNDISGGSGDNVDWDKLEDNMEKEIENRILAYDVMPIDKSFECLQVYSNFEDAVDYWQNMTDGGEFTSEPDADADWAAALAQFPMDLGTIYLIRGQFRMPIYTWDGEMAFLTEDGINGFGGKICNFKVDLNLVKEKTKFTDSKFQEEDLLVMDGHYYGISGQLTDRLTKKEEISRTYTYVDESGDTQEETQEIEVPSYQILTIDQGFIEGYWLIESDISSIYAATEQDMLASREKELFWTDLGVDRVIYDGMTQDTMVSYDPWEAYPYSIVVGQKSVDIFFDHIHMLKAGHYQIPFDAMVYGFKEGTTEYDKKLEDSAGSIGPLYSQREPFSEWQILNIADNDFVIASQKNGLLYYDGDSGAIRQIEKGTWLAVWEEPGDKIVASGFDNSNSGYESKDLVYSKIKEYSRADLLKMN